MARIHPADWQRPAFIPRLAGVFSLAAPMGHFPPVHVGRAYLTAAVVSLRLRLNACL